MGEKNKGMKSGGRIPIFPLPPRLLPVQDGNTGGTEQLRSVVPNSSYCLGASNFTSFKINAYNQQKHKQTERSWEPKPLRTNQFGLVNIICSLHITKFVSLRA